ncbi:MAG TPA: hypothetical protein VG756_12385 [Pseudonocardiaceae bacterium]|jgi:hypothetical protein|nr:hypothetical protein [Pseudonocardiaceae bacterium]
MSQTSVDRRAVPFAALYLKSRQVPASLVALVVGAAAAWALAAAVDSPGLSLRLGVLVAALGVGAGAIGLAGSDPELDRTAALRWFPRRAGHVLGIAALVAAALLVTRWTGTSLAEAGVGFVVRDAAGLAGLAGLGSVALGGQRAWVAPVGWACCAITVMPDDQAVLNWLAQPADNRPAAIAASVLFLGGAILYGLRGSRR